MNDSFEVLWANHIGEVEQGSRHGCDRDALVHRLLLGGQPVPLAPELSVAESEHTAMEANEATGPNALPDPSLPNARGQQLAARDHAVLPPRRGRQTPIRTGWVVFWLHMNP